MRIAAPLLLAAASVSCGPASEPAKKAEAPPPAKILQFYAAPNTIAQGARTLLCYGVEGAATVRLDPPVDDIAPSRTRCLEATPAADTTYTLIARGRAGDEVSQRVTVTVTIDPQPKPRDGMIQFFQALSPQVPKGGAATLCYGVKGAEKVSLSPNVTMLVPSEKICFQVKPEATTVYTLTATSSSGNRDVLAARVVVE